MGSNYHTPWIDRPNPGYTTFSADSMNPALSALDKAITYLKNTIIHCDGEFIYNHSSGELSWNAPIRFLFNGENGYAYQNIASSGSITLSENQFAYVDLDEVNNKTVTVAAATIATGSASNFISYNRLILAYRNAVSKRLFPVALRQPIFTLVDLIYIPEYAGATLTASGSNNDPGTLGMTSDSEVISNVRRNYYEWRSSIQSGLQSYDVVVQIPIPYNFVGFQIGTNTALTLEIKTEENSITNNKLDLIINRNGQAASSSLADQKSSAAATWETIGFDETNTVLAALIAGDILNVLIRMYSQNSKYVRIGKIALQVILY